MLKKMLRFTRKTMKHLLPILFISSLFTACTISEPSVLREKSNASMIEKSIKNLQVAEKIKPYLKKNESIIIVPIESFETFDNPRRNITTGVIQDNLTREFISEGYKVLERDFDMTYRLLSESEETYKHNHFLYLGNGHASTTSSQRKKERKSQSSLGNDGYQNPETKSQDIESLNKIEINTTLNSADKIISYRVVDCGLRYNKSDSLDFDEIARDARTVLEVRVTDAKTSIIDAAILVDGRSQDIIQEEHKEGLKNFDYHPYLHSYPNYWITSEQTTAENNNNNAQKVGWMAGGLLSIVLLLSLIL